MKEIVTLEDIQENRTLVKNILVKDQDVFFVREKIQLFKETTSLVDQNGDELKQVFDSDNVQEDNKILRTTNIIDIHHKTIAQEERLIGIQQLALSSPGLSGGSIKILFLMILEIKKHGFPRLAREWQRELLIGIEGDVISSEFMSA